MITVQKSNSVAEIYILKRYICRKYLLIQYKYNNSYIRMRKHSDKGGRLKKIGS